MRLRPDVGGGLSGIDVLETGPNLAFFALHQQRIIKGILRYLAKFFEVFRSTLIFLVSATMQPSGRFQIVSMVVRL